MHAHGFGSLYGQALYRNVYPFIPYTQQQIIHKYYTQTSNETDKLAYVRVLVEYTVLKFFFSLSSLAYRYLRSLLIVQASSSKVLRYTHGCLRFFFQISSQIVQDIFGMEDSRAYFIASLNSPQRSFFSLICRVLSIRIVFSKHTYCIF